MAWRDLILHNLGWKLVSLVLAIVISIAIRFSQQDDLSLLKNPITIESSRDFREIPIAVMASGTNSRAVQLHPAYAAVTVGGEPDVLRELQEDEIEVFVNLSAVREPSGMRKRIRVHTPPGVHVKALKPEFVLIERFPGPSPEPKSN